MLVYPCLTLATHSFLGEMDMNRRGERICLKHHSYQQTPRVLLQVPLHIQLITVHRGIPQSLRSTQRFMPDTRPLGVLLDKIESELGAKGLESIKDSGPFSLPEENKNY